MVENIFLVSGFQMISIPYVVSLQQHGQILGINIILYSI